MITFGQMEGHNWIFGDSVGINFTTTVPTILTQPVSSSHEGTATISDSTGNLLFYAGAPTNFVSAPFYRYKVWNNQHLVIQNGQNLIGNSSESQGTLILPIPENDSLHYLFHIGRVNNFRYLFYSIIDMNANNGLGKVLIPYNNPVDTTFTLASEYMGAIRHANGRDWWLINHNGSDQYITRLITPSGIYGPWFYATGTAIGTKGIFGQLTSSPDGTMIVLVGMPRVADLFEFDRCTGTISNWLMFGDSLQPLVGSNGFKGCSFSPDNSLLYISTTDSLFQYNLSAPNIINSRQTIFVDNCPDTCHLGQHQIAPDGKIYIANTSGYSWGNNIYDPENMNISYIENPNTIGTGCNFSYLGLNLAGKRCFWGLPNIPNFNLSEVQGSVCDSLLTSTSETPKKSNRISAYYYDGILYIKSTIHQNINLSIYDNTGKVVLKSQEQSNTSLKLNLNPGVYYYNIESSDQSKSGKLFIPE